jgi:C4-type zinc ribbon protein
VKIEATADEIRALLRLAEGNGGGEAAQRRVPRPVLERYRMLVQAGRSPALVAVDRGTCSGCHVRLPTMVEYDVAHSLGIHTCPHCRRMIYAPELLAAPGAGTRSSRRTDAVTAGGRS